MCNEINKNANDDINHFFDDNGRIKEKYMDIYPELRDEKWFEEHRDE